MAKKKQNDERLVQVMVRRGRTVVYGNPVKLHYSPGDVLEVTVDQARQLEEINAVEILEELD